MLRELTESYQPEKVLHREEQLKKINEVFKTFNKFQMGSNLLLQGYSGSGKTTTITKALKDKNGNYVFVSGAQNKTSYKLLKSIFDLNFNTLERTLSEGIKKFKNYPKIIVIDEVNKLKNGVELKDFFDNLNTIYRETSCPIIIITNQRGIIGLIPQDARLTLLFEKIDFKSYNPLQLNDIVEERVKEIQKKHQIEIPEGRIKYICAIACKEMDGSARAVLRIVQRSILKNDFSKESIHEALTGILEEEWREFIIGLSQNQQKFLSLLVLLAGKNKKISFPDILNQLDKYTPSRISQLLDIFQDYGIIKSENINHGRAGGNKRFVSFTSELIFNKISDLTEEIIPLS